MPYTLLLRLAGPLQAWGVSSRFSIRETLDEPTKSGAIGLLCAALGWDRTAPTHVVAGQPRPLAELAALPFGVRVVQAGVQRRDYHTAQQVLRAKAKLRPGKHVAGGDLQETVLSERYYLSDAYFLAGFESDDLALLEALDAAMAQPHWPLALGRKAFVPSLPVRYATPAYGPAPAAASIVPLPLAEALLLANDPAWYTLPRQRSTPVRPFGMHRLVLEAGSPAAVVAAASAIGIGLAAVRSVQYLDVPLSFAPRRFAPRTVTLYAPSTNVSDQARTQSA